MGFRTRRQLEGGGGGDSGPRGGEKPGVGAAGSPAGLETVVAMAPGTDPGSWRCRSRAPLLWVPLPRPRLSLPPAFPSPLFPSAGAGAGSVINSESGDWSGRPPAAQRRSPARSGAETPADAGGRRAGVQVAAPGPARWVGVGPRAVGGEGWGAVAARGGGAGQRGAVDRHPARAPRPAPPARGAAEEPAEPAGSPARACAVARSRTPAAGWRCACARSGQLGSHRGGCQAESRRGFRFQRHRLRCVVWQERSWDPMPQFPRFSNQGNVGAFLGAVAGLK